MDLGRDMETLPLAAGQTEDLEAEAEGLDATPPADAQSRLYDQLRNVRIGPARSLMGTTVLNAINRFGRGKVVLGSMLALATVVGLATSRSPLAAKAFHGGPELQLLQDANYSTANIRPGVSLSSGLTIRNYGQDCWSACGKAGFCQEFCGAGNACCRFLQATDPIECSGVWDFGIKTEHTCVAPVNPTFWVKAYDLSVHNWGEDCLAPCEHAGYCQEFCGEGNVCCKWGDARDPAECGGIISWGSKDRHTCVKPVRPEYVVDLKSSSPSMQNWGQDCWDACGKSGLCQEFCGLGNACCRFGSIKGPAECVGITSFGAKDRHTCVTPVAPYYVAKVEPSPGVTNWGQDCLAPCNDAGYCQEFCGMGNACCKWGERDAVAPPECKDIIDFGSKDRHTCVAPVLPFYKTAAQSSEEATVLQWGQDCWEACGGSGYCPDFCGFSSACCRFQSLKDPVECRGITEFGAKDRHTCVAPVDPVWQVQTQPEAKNWGEDCWVACGETGGVCPDFCGAGNACCRFNPAGTLYGEDPPECYGIKNWGAKDEHTCVRPVAMPFVNHVMEDCWSPCNGAGMCEAWCGSGNACCHFAKDSDPAECKGVTYWPTYTSHTCVKAAPLTAARIPPSPAADACIPGEVKDAQGNCRHATNTTVMTFYMYHATSDKWGYGLANANLGNLEGVLWFLQNQVLTTCPRRDDISRIVRYVVTMRNPAALFEGSQHSQFGQYTDFKNGKCVFNSSECSSLWKRYGYAVGCKPLDTDGAELPNYAGPPQPVWYSLPGACPSNETDAAGNKPYGCWNREPGGMCYSPDATKTCTWKADYAGEVLIDELSGITDPIHFCARGNREYDPARDEGVGTSFWNGRRSAEQCEGRVKYVRDLFSAKFPSYPVTLGEPRCDWSELRR